MGNEDSAKIEKVLLSGGDSNGDREKNTGSSSSRGRKSRKVYSADEAIDKMGFGPFQLMIFFFCGLLWLADAMELMILSILSPAVKCQWDLSSAEEAIITSVVFIGALIGSLFWGVFGDTFGRKKALLGMDLVVLIFGVLSALKLTPDDNRSAGYPWLLACRFGVGFGAAGVTQAATYYIEFLPKKTRAVCSICVAGWWGIGTMFGAALAVAVMGENDLGWHWYLGLSACPMAAALLFFLFVPESARFYLAKGKKKQAEKVLRRVAWFNFKSLPEGSIVSYEEWQKEKEYNGEKPTVFESNHEEKKGHITSSFNDTCTEDNNSEKDPLLAPEGVKKEEKRPSYKEQIKSGFANVIEKFPLLFRNGMWKTTAILSVLWFGSAWLYYGIVLLTTTIFQYNPHCGLTDNMENYTNSSSFYSNATECEEHELDTNDYLKIMWTSGAEMPGLIVTIFIIEIVGRKITMAVNFSITLIGYCLLFICTNEALLTFFLSLIRAFVTGVFQTMYVYTPEVYPTKVRGFGIGFLFSIARVGAIVTPYVAQVLFQASDYAAIAMYAGSALILIVLALLLPLETKGKSLRDKT